MAICSSTFRSAGLLPTIPSSSAQRRFLVRNRTGRLRIDNGSNDSTAVPGANKIDYDAERGPSDFDVRHSFSGAVTYDIPTAGPGFARAAPCPRYRAGARSASKPHQAVEPQWLTIKTKEAGYGDGECCFHRVRRLC